MKFLHKFSLAFVLLLTSGCTVLQLKKDSSVVEIADGVKFKLIDFAAISEGKEISQKYDVRGSFEELFFSIKAKSKIDKDGLEVIGISPVIGTRIFILRYKNGQVEVKHSKYIDPDPRIKPEYIIADIQLIFADIVDLRSAFVNKEVKISEEKNGKKIRRIFSLKKEPFIEITYSNQDRFNSEISYKHLERNYEYLIN